MNPLELYQTSLRKQFDAALCTMDLCVSRCPEQQWHTPVVSLQFCQVAFHAVFFADLYLGWTFDEVRRQPFHVRHADVFADYEELQDRVQKQVYEKPFISDYLLHCRAKVGQVLSAETPESLARDPGFEGRSVCRAEMHLTNVRHLFHHAGQLSLVLRRDHDIDIPWIQSGWIDV